MYLSYIRANGCDHFLPWELQLEVNLYNYGDVGHFWVKGYEYLRILEYRLAILNDKCEYLGEEAAM